MIKVQKNIPLPKRQGGRRLKYPLADLKVGDSFFAPDSKQKNIAAGLAARVKKLKFKIATRKEGNGTRVWRVK